MGEGKGGSVGFRKGEGEGREQEAAREATGLWARSPRSHGNVSLRPRFDQPLRSLRPASRLFPPSSFVPRRTLTRRMRKGKKKIPARRIYKRDSGLFLQVPPGVSTSEDAQPLPRYSSCEHCEL